MKTFKTFKFLSFVICLALLLACLPAPAAAIGAPSVDAPNAIVLDRATGEVLFGKGEDARVDPAGTTKLMTGLLAVEAVEAGKASFNDMVTVTGAIETGLGADAVRCGLQIGEQITLNALLQCALITGADDAANAVADYIGGTVSAFVAQMNARAAALGCDGTAFVNAHGAHSAGHYATARDACRIAEECTKHDRLLRICDTVVAELAETNLSGVRTLRNTNALICDETPYGAAYLYEDASGLISGYNAEAGGCVVSTASRDGINLLCAVFSGAQDADGAAGFADAIALFDWVFDNYAYYEVVKSSENIASVDVAMGMDATYVNIRPATSITILLPKDSDLDAFEKDIRVYALENGETVTAPVTAGEVLGEVTLTRAGKSFGTVKLVASSTVQLSRLQYIRSQIRETTRQRNFRITVAVLAVLFVAYLIWVLIYRIKRLRHLRAVRMAERERALRMETAMKAAPELKSPGIRFFNERGQTSPPEPLPTPTAPQPGPAPEPEDGGKIVSLFSAQRPAPEEAAPAPDAPAAPAEDAAPGDLLASAMLVARLEPTPAHEETPEEKAERDYFEEFFRPKK